MKTVNITLSYENLHKQVCNLCAAYDWLQQADPATGVMYPFITPDMQQLIHPQYLRLMKNASSVLRAWISYTVENDHGLTMALTVPPHVSEGDVKTLLESYIVDSILRKYSHTGRKGNHSDADEPLYLLAGMLTPDEEDLYEDDLLYGEVY